jgi:16S rRNA (uracil1498-N3)-methyltransferase
MNSKAVESKEKHEFALFVESLSLLIQGKKTGDSVVFSDEKTIHRIKNVLRLDIQDQCIIFDRHTQILAEIMAFTGKKHISITIQSIQKTVILQPTIIFLLPLLKRDDYESALYALTEIGINTIQLVFTQKTSHQWAGKRDIERAERILIAAAEQSKNFAYPHIKEPISLETALQKYGIADVKLFFDPAGKHLFDVMCNVRETKVSEIVLLVGPEGDLSLEEKKLVQKDKFIFCALTPTIMRAVQAATLGAGLVRSIF